MARQPTTTKPREEEPRVEIIDCEEDIIAGFDCACNAFGHQVRDTLWIAMNPGWETPEGRARVAAKLVEKWRNVTYDNQGNANTIFLKATVSDQGRPVVAGLAVWDQLSIVEGYGERPSDDQHILSNIESLYPGDEVEQRYLFQVMRSFVKRRVEVVKEKATSHPPAVMHLRSCSVDPAYQRRGIALKLAQWGLDEARRRGGLEAVTEASSMGRHVYSRLGFHGEGPDMEYEVDSEFLSRERPPNLFMRTGTSQ
ncbi:hypothetical protein F4815DRAFT_58617 [Daldinia loculata]|uniref:uncharacterized protein n=1 Tax=Daldinia loculata TaxID=103429 RepID=UPI0020C45C49|nr:uncharacterized protein F4817DRAFT_333724 [Daldinia loculata]KAI1648676.1 hypothetical protein F4817DRAFT_333724 [Daldinia loculata]KAI2768461.1 hypothetical protein F4815DRAFT_58617 [Daldinia loculata]